MGVLGARLMQAEISAKHNSYGWQRKMILIPSEFHLIKCTSNLEGRAGTCIFSLLLNALVSRLEKLHYIVDRKVGRYFIFMNKKGEE